ncbi:hypothetical protein [Streptomyces sp. NBC_01237]|uniref:hypothetical protein n=1 Tax=Streptomyces sp. NBC_01237 TaxID=2903790 RepID=UPI002DDACF13|nr:hypothetical protein [Streptomyces sp. NBC_01237]WRZ73110.1 hypothetical protein OG251_16550 [Streptomyces sp. NBC_01237]
MAGESPDKTEQQKSSGTAPEERDPRLAVFREPAADAAPDTDATPDTASDRAEAPDAAADGDADAGADAGAGAETDAGAGSVTDRTTDTATAVFRTRPADAEGGAAATAASTGPEGGSTPPEGAGASEGAEAGSAAPEAPEADETDGADGSAEAAVTEAAAKATGSGESDAAAEGDEPAAEPGDARLRAAVAAWVDSEDDAESDEAVTSGAKASDDAEASDGTHGTDGTAKGSGEARVPKSRGEAVVPASESDSASGPDAEASADDGDGDGNGGSDGDGNGGSDGDGDAKPAEPTSDLRGIDQPTAVFKAPKMPKEAKKDAKAPESSEASKAAHVDHPTTALKIPPREAKPETAAERTSKFVPLRSDDVRPTPAPRKPEPAAPAAGGPEAAPDKAAKPAPTPAPRPAWAAEPERTRQQPLPPKPPLDLLAELTNTPPPQETPVRTAVRRVKIWTPLVLLLLVVFAIVQMVRPLPTPTLQLTAQPTYTFEGSKPKLPWPDQGQGYMAATGLGVVDLFGEQKPVPIASVAKAMTAYIVLRDHPLKRGEDGPSIEVDAKGESDGQLFTEGESTLDTVKKGDKISEKDALSALMIPSANNIARLLARWDAGSEKAFVTKMNDTAKQLGMKNTTYTDPSGLNATTVSTAEDLVKLGEKLVEIPALMDITKLPEWKDPSGKTWRNYNTLVPFDGALGIKTGSTTKAGGNLLFAAHKMVDGTDQLIVGAVLGQYSESSIIDAVNAASKKVMIATQDELKGAKIVKKGQVVGAVDDGLGGTTPVVATKDVRAVGWAGLTVKLELTDGGKTVPNSAPAGTEVGTLTVGEGASQVKVPVALRSELAEPAFDKKLTRVG